MVHPQWDHFTNCLYSDFDCGITAHAVKIEVVPIIFMDIHYAVVFGFLYACCRALDRICSMISCIEFPVSLSMNSPHGNLSDGIFGGLIIGSGGDTRQFSPSLKKQRSHDIPCFGFIFFSFGNNSPLSMR